VANPKGLSILKHMQTLKHRIKAHNIIYIEGVDPDTFVENSDVPDLWNDVRCVIRDDGEILLCAIATTEPGRFFTENPMNPGGAARIAFGQYLDAWTFGSHGRSRQDALVQCGEIKVCRDLNQDYRRTGDRVDCGDDFGVNQHTTVNSPNTIGQWSAGCLVGRYPQTHAKFMDLCRTSGYKTFDTTIFDGSELHELGVL
jgi:hypothetical protein